MYLQKYSHVVTQHCKAGYEVTKPLSYRDQLLRGRTLRALRTMKSLPNFHSDLCDFVLEESRREASTVADKDDPTSQFDLDCIKNFTYDSELEKFKKSNP